MALSMREQAPAGHVSRRQRQLPPIPQRLSTEDSLDDENYEAMDTSVRQIYQLSSFIYQTTAENLHYL